MDPQVIQAILAQLRARQAPSQPGMPPGASPLYPKPGYMTPADPSMTPGAPGTTPIAGAAPPVPAPGAVMPSPRNTMLPSGQGALGWGGSANQMGPQGQTAGGLPAGMNPQIQAILQAIMAKRGRPQ